MKDARRAQVAAGRQLGRLWLVRSDEGISLAQLRRISFFEDKHLDAEVGCTSVVVAHHAVRLND